MPEGCCPASFLSSFTLQSCFPWDPTYSFHSMVRSALLHFRFCTLLLSVLTSLRILNSISWSLLLYLFSEQQDSAMYHSCLAHPVLYQEIIPRNYQKTSQPGHSNLLGSENMGSKQGGLTNISCQSTVMLNKPHFQKISLISHTDKLNLLFPMEEKSIQSLSSTMYTADSNVMQTIYCMLIHNCNIKRQLSSTKPQMKGT